MAGQGFDINVASNEILVKQDGSLPGPLLPYREPHRDDRVDRQRVLDLNRDCADRRSRPWKRRTSQRSKDGSDNAGRRALAVVRSGQHVRIAEHVIPGPHIAALQPALTEAEIDAEIAAARADRARRR